jgi:GTP-binding protein
LKTTAFNTEPLNLELRDTMIIKTAEFIKSAVKPAHYPDENLPEIAFAGRSNVGKSSLINTLVNRKRLVKTSGTPGRTQLINFFRFNQHFVFVDLPGYGYAKVPKAIRSSWGPMIETYLSTREELAAMVLIMDLRRTPDEREHTFLSWCRHHQIPTVPVLTKSDKLTKSKRNKQLSMVSGVLGMAEADIIVFSAKSRQGKDKLWAVLEQLIQKAGQGSNGNID